MSGVGGDPLVPVDASLVTLLSIAAAEGALLVVSGVEGAGVTAGDGRALERGGISNDGSTGGTGTLCNSEARRVFLTWSSLTGSTSGA